MSNIEYFNASNPDEFWEELTQLIAERNNEYIVSIAANVISVKNIKFPAIDVDKINSYLFPPNSVNMDRKIVFENCIFGDTVEWDTTKRINEIKLDGCIFKHNVLISLRPIKTLYINKCIFEEKLEFNDIIVSKQDKLFIFQYSEVRGTLKITDSYLEYAEFYNLTLQNASIEISNTILTGLKCNNVNWGDKFNCNRDTCRQLKVVMEQHKNYIDANYFHSLELDEYRKELFSTAFFNKFEDKLLFGFNWAVSNFSTSWLRPLILLIVFSLITYCILCCMKCISPCNINGFFEFFNPLSKAASTEYKNIYWIWFLHKVISGFFLYHFIIAMKRSTRT